MGHYSFDGHYFTQMVYISITYLMVKLALEFNQWPLPHT